jgi:lipopolysaccharide export system permease protein
MTILDRYIGSRMLSTFVKTLVSLVLLFILIDLLTRLRSDIVRNEVPLTTVFLYYLAYVPTILFRYQIAALSVLISALLVLGNAAQNNEMTAAFTGGISLSRFVRMPVLIAFGLAVAVFAMEETIGPISAAKVSELDSYFFSSRGAQSKRPGVSWAHLDGGWSCHIMKFNRVALTGENILMHSTRDDAIEQIQARRIFWDPDAKQWMLEDGRWYVFQPHEQMMTEGRRIKLTPAPISETPEELFAVEQPPDTKTIAGLAADIRRANDRGMQVGAHWTDFYAKFSQPALSFVMIWLAIPFAMRLRKGGLAIGFGISIAIALAYMMMSRISIGLGHHERLYPFLAAWLANIVFFVLGLALFRKTVT